jgi:hypothetical protein
MKAGIARRVAQGIALAAGSAALFGSLYAGPASAATQSTSGHAMPAAAPKAPPPPGTCYASRDGWKWYDLETGIVYICGRNYLGEWAWMTYGVFVGGCPSGIRGSIPGIKPDAIPGITPKAIICS